MSDFKRLCPLVMALSILATPGSAADQVLEGAQHISRTSPREIQASVLDGAIRRTVTVDADLVDVVVDVPEGQPLRIEVEGLQQRMLPYVRGRVAHVHVRRLRDVAVPDPDKVASTTGRSRR